MSYQFKVGDRVVSIRLPDGVMSVDHVVGTAGVIVSIDDYQNTEEYFVEFDDGDGWYCASTDLKVEKPLPTLEEVAAGLDKILGTETFGDYIERLADEYDDVMGFILGRTHE